VTTPPPRLHRALWLWFPPLLAVVVIGVKLLAPGLYDSFIEGELGLTELATPLVSVLGVVFGLQTVRLSRGRVPPAITLWFALTTLGCFYFAGEELSWGQQLFQWRTPAEIAELNDQNETNLHNMSSWFDQKPRLLLELWVLIGGLVLPLRRLAGGSPRAAAGSGWDWFWPGLECLPTAALAIAIKLPERYKKLAGIESLPFEIRWSEPQEYYFALFLLIYLLAARARLRRALPPS
jgi:hypothetical protein